MLEKEEDTPRTDTFTPEEIIDIVDTATKNFKGDLTNLESAIGMLIVGRRMGWRVMYLVHSRRTIRKYEKILNINIKDSLPDVNDYTKKSVAFGLYKKIGKFWSIVKGEVKGIKTPEIKDL